MGYKFIPTLTKKEYQQQKNSQDSQDNFVKRFEKIVDSSLYKSVKKLMQKYHAKYNQKGFDHLVTQLTKIDFCLRPIETKYWQDRQLMLIFVDKCINTQISSRKSDAKIRNILDMVQSELNNARIQSQRQGRLFTQQQVNQQQDHWRNQLRQVIALRDRGDDIDMTAAGRGTGNHPDRQQQQRNMIGGGMIEEGEEYFNQQAVQQQLSSWSSSENMPQEVRRIIEGDEYFSQQAVQQQSQQSQQQSSQQQQQQQYQQQSSGWQYSEDMELDE